MGRSQRHLVWEQGASSAGEIHAQGAVAPGIAMQVDPSALNVLKPGPGLSNTGLEWKEPPDMTSVEVPTGPSGGPLQGSSLTGAIPESLEPGPGPGPGPGPDPAPGEEPVLNSINPSSTFMGGADLTMTVTGNRFTDTSVIWFNNGPENTNFIDSGKITTIVKPSLATVPITVPVYVMQGNYKTNEKTFTFKDPNAIERVFPIGPINLAKVEDHADGIQLTLSETMDIQVGDTVTIAATGNTSVNGSYTVLSIDPVVVDNPIELPSPIDGVGRVTVTGAG